jgi:hypothetical protein
MKDLLNAISSVATPRHTEEDLKMAMEPLIQKHLREIGDIEIRPTYEVSTGLVGRRDAVYGHFTLEYKRPGRLSNESNLKNAAQQLAEYLEADAGGADATEALKRVSGACTDGERIFFLRYWPESLIYSRQIHPRRQLSLFGTEDVPGGFQMIGPFSVSESSLEELFRYMRALGRKPLSAEPLAETFGPNSDVARAAVGALYAALTKAESERVQVFYNQWERVFGVVYGEETDQAEHDVPELAAGYGLPEDASLKPSLFAVHTYFALIMKLLAAEILALQVGSLAQSIISELPGLDETSLFERLARLENGDDYRVYGIHNFLEGDFFRWYLDAWNEVLGQALRALPQALSDFEPTTPTLQPGEARDLLKKLYQYLVPKRLRHDLGEYYTPDWLAERLLNQLGYDGDPEIRLLDPSCGSGTFLTLALARVREKMEFELWDRDPERRRDCAEKTLRNIVGFDLNPLAVIAARTNYLLAFGDLLRDVRPIEIPVYNCDSVLTPVLQRRDQQLQLALAKSQAESLDYFYLPTTVGEFRMPTVILDKHAIGLVTSMVEECVAADYSAEEFLDRLSQRLELDPGAHMLLEELYDQLLELEHQGKNGLWARLLKNSFAPVLQEPFDIVAGNPPWVNWESLPDSWKVLSKDLWIRYGLFSLKGHAARMGGGKKDIAMLFMYVCADHYLKNKGQLGFVITQTVFKTKGAGDGFRRFQLGEEGPCLRVKTVDDLSVLQPFEGATNRTAILTLIKGETTRYPVTYTIWQGMKGKRIPLESTLREASEQSRRRNFFAEPVDSDKYTSPWITAPRHVLLALRKVINPSAYRAYEGSNTGGLNGVFWIQILDRRPDGAIVIENLAEIGKKDVQAVRASIEPDLVYQLLRGRDIKPWQTSPEAWLLLTQDTEKRIGWPEAKMKSKWPMTYQYLKQFEEQLRRRSGFIKYFDASRDPFWSMYNIGPYTLAQYKVVWKEVADNLVAAVISEDDSGKTVIPDHTVVFIPFSNEREAHYVCALLGSSLARAVVRFYVVGHPSPHVMKYINIPEFDPKEDLHNRLAALSLQAHQSSEDTDKIQQEIDYCSAMLWNISKGELNAILEELRQ